MTNTQYATVTIPSDVAIYLTYVLLRASSNSEFTDAEQAAAHAVREAIYFQTSGK